MKLLLFVSVYCLLQLQSTAQCNNYLLLQNNKKVTMTIYNKKGKEDGKQTWLISNVKKTGSNTSATVASEFIDKKGKSLNKATNEIKCSGGSLQMNMKMMLGEAQAKQMGNAKVNAKGEFLDYPAVVKEGDALKDGKLEMDFTMEGGMAASLTLEITNRKAVGKETVTSTAGNWECIKITSNQKMTTRIGGIGIPFKLELTEWYALGVGVVKTESKYGSTLITSIE